MGFHFPFPRIFDRTVMVTLLGALLIWSRSMGFAGLMREGFAAPRANLPRVLIGLAISLGAIAILGMLGLLVVSRLFFFPGLWLGNRRGRGDCLLVVAAKS